MKHLKTFESHSKSTDYYLNFDESIFPKEISFDDPKSNYKSVKFIPKMNSVYISYELDSEVDSNNPYKGTIPDILTFEFSVTYDMNNKQDKSLFVSIISGSQTWLEFSYKNDEIEYIDEPKCKLSSVSEKEIKDILKKYSS